MKYIYLRSETHAQLKSHKASVSTDQIWLNLLTRSLLTGRAIFRILKTYIYIYAFSRRFYPKRLTVHSGYTFVLLVYVFPGNRTHNLCAANAML